VKPPSAYNMQDWLIGLATPVCECGASKLNQGDYAHSAWCPRYVAHTKEIICQCTPNYHVASCPNRIWPEAPRDLLKEKLERFKISIDKLCRKS